jgi:hypothetical protein
MPRFVLRRSPLCLVGLLLLGAVYAADGPKAPAPPIPAAIAAENPAVPVFVRFALPPRGEQVVLVKLRSDGVSKLRNVAFVDANLNGQFEPSEKQVGKVIAVKSDPAKGGSCIFDRIKMPLPPGGEETGFNTITCVSSYMVIPQQGTEIDQFVMTATKLTRGHEHWAWGTICPVKPGVGITAAPVGAVGGVKLAIESQPDKEKPGNTGFGVELATPGATMANLARDGQPCKVTIKVTDASGASVHQDTVELSKLAFG